MQYFENLQSSIYTSTKFFHTYANFIPFLLKTMKLCISVISMYHYRNTWSKFLNIASEVVCIRKHLKYLDLDNFSVLAAKHSLVKVKSNFIAFASIFLHLQFKKSGVWIFLQNLNCKLVIIFSNRQNISMKVTLK